MSDQRRDPIRIVPYDPAWPASFARERDRIEAALGDRIVGRVEHIGSTAVPGLAAKPIIDMSAVVADYDGSNGLAPALATIGWLHTPEPGDEAGRKWSFCFPDPAWRTHHLHVLEASDPIWRGLLRFRDHLRQHPELAAEYARIKSDLARADDHDHPKYRAAKAPFIERVAVVQRRHPLVNATHPQPGAPLFRAVTIVRSQDWDRAGSRPMARARARRPAGLRP